MANGVIPIASFIMTIDVVIAPGPGNHRDCKWHDCDIIVLPGFVFFRGCKFRTGHFCIDHLHTDTKQENSPGNTERFKTDPEELEDPGAHDRCEQEDQESKPAGIFCNCDFCRGIEAGCKGDIDQCCTERVDDDKYRGECQKRETENIPGH